jgi:hypothetical protein
VKRLSALRYLFAALAIAGLILTPMAAPAMAMATPANIADETAMAMPADMPCCPDQAPMPGCGKDCPFMALCATQFLSMMPQGTALVMPPTRASLIMASNDAGLSGLKQRPPPRPPKL